MKKCLITILCATLCTTLLLVGCGEEYFAEPEFTDNSSNEQEYFYFSEEGTEPEFIDNSPIFEIENPIIFNAEGVTVTMDDWYIAETDFNQRLYMDFSISNHNPDNKKVYFNSFYVYDSGRLLYNYADNRFSFEITSAGESDTAQCTFFFNYYDAFKEMLSTESIPIKYLLFYYTIKIGSDGEEMSGYTVFRNPEYIDEDFLNICGKKIGDFNGVADDNCNFSYDVYSNHLENGYTLITIKRTDNNFDYISNATVSLYINDIEVDITSYLTSNIDSYYGDNNATINADGGIVCFAYDTPENIRKEYEIPNNVPLDGTLDIKIGWCNNEFSIPVSLE